MQYIYVYICTHHECEVDKIDMQASPAYTSVAMATPMGPQLCEDEAPPSTEGMVGSGS